MQVAADCITTSVNSTNRAANCTYYVNKNVVNNVVNSRTASMTDNEGTSETPISKKNIELLAVTAR